jgi:hypothetical protein
MDWNELSLEPHHQGVPSGVSKKIFEPIGKFRAKCAPYNDANTISEQTDARLHMTHVT